jgi:hypothetical protein
MAGAPVAMVVVDSGRTASHHGGKHWPLGPTSIISPALGRQAHRIAASHLPRVVSSSPTHMG